MLQDSFFRAVMSRRSLVRRALASTVIAIAAVTVTACAGDDPPSSPSGIGPSVPGTQTFASSLGVNIAAMSKRSDNLYVQDLTVGTGAEAVVGRTLRMNYTGWLANGQQFDSSVGRGPFEFRLGSGNVIQGWDQGIVGMRVGGKRRLVIGSALGYGTTGQGSIGPNQTLVFDVELLSVQ